jgi:hypothetical protein
MRKPTISMLKMIIRALRRDAIYSPTSVALALNHIEVYQIDVWSVLVTHYPLNRYTEVRWLNQGKLRYTRYDLHSEIANILEILSSVAAGTK